MNFLPFQHLAVALALGLLVGMQRERSEHRFAGVRTFPLITMLGTVCALLAPTFGGWMLAVGLLAIAALVVVANLARQRTGELDIGATTEVSALLLYAVGALVVVNTSAAVLVCGVVALLLHLKPQLHRLVAAIGERELKAIMQFVLVSLVILPVLPNAAYGPYGVLNPFKIWLMVVLIVAINLSAYVVFKLLGGRKGTLVGGVLGGLVSSTAATVSFARASRSGGQSTALFATVIVLASTVVFARVLGLIAAVAAPAFPHLAPPLAAMFGAMCVLALALFFFNRKKQMQASEPENPADLKSALVFGVIYAGVLLLVASARDRFGEAGLYTVAVLSGLADMDAITLSTSQLAATGQLETGSAWRAILTAALSNIVFKTALVAALGSRRLLLVIAGIFALALAAGGAILWLWP